MRGGRKRRRRRRRRKRYRFERKFLLRQTPLFFRKPGQAREDKGYHASYQHKGERGGIAGIYTYVSRLASWLAGLYRVKHAFNVLI